MTIREFLEKHWHKFNGSEAFQLVEMAVNREYLDEDDRPYRMHELDDMTQGMKSSTLLESLDDNFSIHDDFFRIDSYGYYHSIPVWNFVSEYENYLEELSEFIEKENIDISEFISMRERGDMYNDWQDIKDAIPLF